jgi:hypothetical protein
MVGEITENNMDMGTLTADQAAQQQQILRQQRMAEMLMQQGMQQPQGQMVSGRYVAPSITQNLANLANLYVGQRGVEKADRAQIDLANRLRQQGVQESQDIISTMRGRQATPEVVPQGQTLLDDQGMMTMGSQRGVAGAAPDLQSAYAKAIGSRSPQGQALAPVLAKQLMREPKWEKVEQLDQKTGDTITGMVDVNSPNPESTYRPIGVSKPAMSQKDIIDFRDRGINVGGGAPMASGQGGGNQVSNMGAQAMGYNPNLSPAKNRELAFNKANRQAEFAEKAPAALEMMSQTITNINDLIGDTKVVNGKVVYGVKKPHEGFESSVGFSGAPLAKYISGSPVADFRGRFDQIKDKTFLQAFENLKGAGQITEVEGAKATSALNRMSLAQSEKEFIIAAREFEENVTKGMQLARERAGFTTPNTGWRVK